MANFWTEKIAEPKRKFRWLLYFSGAPQFIIKSVTKPSLQIGNSSHQFLQHTFNFPGRVTWQDISITLVDPVNPDATQSIYDIILAAGYQLPNQVISGDAGPEGRRTISKSGMVGSLSNFIRIDQISADSAAEIIESWRIWNPQLTSVNFDSLDYVSDDPLNIQLNIKYDWAELNSDGTANQVGTSWYDAAANQPTALDE